MYWQYQKKEKLFIDDIFGARMKYLPYDFTYGGVEYLYIGNKNYSLGEYFDSDEFLSACSGPNFIDKRVVDALIYLRSNYGPIRVNSTYRNHTCNEAVGGKKDSRHLNGKAVDFQFIYERSRSSFMDDVKDKTCLFHVLRGMGINGFGAYENHFHIDSRSNLSVWGRFVDNSMTACCE